MSARLVNFPKKPEGMKMWDWLRERADELERDGSTETDLAVLVTVRQAQDGCSYWLRATRFNATRLETVGALHTAAHDFNNDDDA